MFARNYLSIFTRNMSKHHVFVYGTLKTGEPNYNWMLNFKKGQFKFVSKGKTSTKYPLVIASKYNIPFLLNVPGTGHNVQGEVYEVDDPMLEHLDVLEDHPNFYVREEQDIITEPEGKIQRCWIYLIKKFRPELLQLPHLQNYESEGSHGLRYCESDNEATLDDL